ncbi:two-component hybrid sensor and regulator, partial [Trichormus variabilis FSR]|nr:two-component hybrid sensor and regulator [Trichormus variabilis FSR]
GEIIQEARDNANQLPDSDDVIDDLLALKIDDEIQNSNELEQTNTSSDFDDLFSDTETNLPTNSELQLIALPEDLSLNNIFNDSEENKQLLTEKSEISDLLDLPPVDNLGNLWNSATEVEPEQILESVIEEDIAQALEESLFEAAASGDIFVENRQFTSHLNESLDPDDLNITFLQDEQQLDLLFASDTSDDLFGELTINTHDTHRIDVISDDIQFLREISQVSPPEIHDFSQQPEVLDFTPEFTTQIQELSAIDDLSSLTSDLTDITFTETNDSSSLETVAETNELDLDDDLSALNSDLADITFTETHDSSSLETVAGTNELDLDDDLSALNSDLADITFTETNDSSSLETVAETSELSLDDDLSA